jgi:hypothetical protein
MAKCVEILNVLYQGTKPQGSGSDRQPRFGTTLSHLYSRRKCSKLSLFVDSKSLIPHILDKGLMPTVLRLNLGKLDIKLSVRLSINSDGYTRSIRLPLISIIEPDQSAVIHSHVPSR